MAIGTFPGCALYTSTPLQLQCSIDSLWSWNLIKKVNRQRLKTLPGSVGVLVCRQRINTNISACFAGVAASVWGVPIQVPPAGMGLSAAPSAQHRGLSGHHLLLPIHALPCQHDKAHEKAQASTVCLCCCARLYVWCMHMQLVDLCR